MSDIGLSVIVPLYNDKENVPPLHETIKRGVAPLGIEYGIIFADDGSHDQTFTVVEAIAWNDNHLRVIKSAHPSKYLVNFGSVQICLNIRYRKESDGGTYEIPIADKFLPMGEAINPVICRNWNRGSDSGYSMGAGRASGANREYSWDV